MLINIENFTFVFSIIKIITKTRVKLTLVSLVLNNYYQKQDL